MSQDVETLKKQYTYQKKFGSKKKAQELKSQIDEIRGKSSVKKVNLTFSCPNCGLNVYVEEPDSFYKGQKCLHYKSHLIQTTESGLYWNVRFMTNKEMKFTGQRIRVQIEVPVTEECNYFTFKNSPGVRVDCYFAVMKKYRKYCGDAHFEMITRARQNHILSPSWDLLNRYKAEKWDFSKYRENFLREMNHPKCEEKIAQLREISKTKTVFLICYEKDPSQCHRSIVKELIEQGDES